MPKKKESIPSKPSERCVTIKLTPAQKKQVKDVLGVDLEDLNIVETVHYELGVSVRGWPPAWGGCPSPNPVSNAPRKKS